MRALNILFLSLLFFNCQSNKKEKIEEADVEIYNEYLYEPLATEAASEDQNYQAGLDFLNAYIETKDTLEILEFVKTSPLASENLKEALEKMVIEAWEENPKIGLQFDPLFDAQDYPAEGMELYEFDPTTGIVIAQGIDWNKFKVALRLINSDGHILVDGCGAVNMPADERVAR